jgi:hypothetical protein
MLTCHIEEHAKGHDVEAVLGCEVLILLAYGLELVGGRIEDLNIGCQVLVSPVLTRH